MGRNKSKYFLKYYSENNHGKPGFRIKVNMGSNCLKQFMMNGRDWTVEMVESVIDEANSKIQQHMKAQNVIEIVTNIVNGFKKEIKIPEPTNDVIRHNTNNSPGVIGTRLLSAESVVKNVLTETSIKLESDSVDTLPNSIIEFNKSFKEQGYGLVNSKMVYNPVTKKSKLELNYTQDVIYKARPIDTAHTHYQEYKGQTFKYLIISDIHVPYHNISYIYGLIDYAAANGYYGIIVNGDLMDQEYLSSYTVSMRVLGLDYVQKQINMAGDLIKYIESKNFKRMIFLEGNHDERICRSIFGQNISGKGVKKYGTDLDFYSLGALLGFDPKWEYGYYKDSVQIGDWRITHGEEHNKNLNPDIVKSNLLVGHTHRVNHVTNSFRFEGVRYTYQEIRTGCLLDLMNPSVPRMNERQLDTWVNGFAVITTDGSNTYVSNCIIDTSTNSTCIDNNIIYFK